MNEIRRNSPIRTLIVDDSPLMRNVLGEILTRDGDIEIAGMASNGREGLEKIAALNPDVVTLDMDMPVMNGMVTLKHIMIHHQLPVVIISSLIQDGFFAFEALRLGVMDFIPKLSRVAGADRNAEEEIFRKRVRLAAEMQVHQIRRVNRLRKEVQTPPHRTGDKTEPTFAVTLGTGNDGVRGMELVRSKGGLTIVQEQETCVYPELVRHAVRHKCVDLVLPVHGIADRLNILAAESGMRDLSSGS